MKKEARAKNFIKKPVYKGGLKAMRSFIKQHLQYPLDALSNQIEGTVFVKYTINYKGKIIDTKLIKGIGYGCDEEAIRLVKLLQFKIAKNRKIKIQFHKSLQIHFKLPKQQTSKLSYNYTPSTLSSKQKESDTSNSYNYSINIG